MNHIFTITITVLIIFAAVMFISDGYSLLGMLLIFFGLSLGVIRVYADSKGTKNIEDMKHYVQNVLYPDEIVTVGIANDNPNSIYTNKFVVQSQEGTEELEVKYIKSIDSYTYTKKPLNDDSYEKANNTTAEVINSNTDKNGTVSGELKTDEVEKFIKEEVFVGDSNNLQLKQKEVDSPKSYTYYAKHDGKLYEVIVVPDEEFDGYHYELNEIDIDF